MMHASEKVLAGMDPLFMFPCLLLAAVSIVCLLQYQDWQVVHVSKHVKSPTGLATRYYSLLMHLNKLGKIQAFKQGRCERRLVELRVTPELGNNTVYKGNHC